MLKPAAANPVSVPTIFRLDSEQKEPRAIDGGGVCHASSPSASLCSSHPRVRAFAAPSGCAAPRRRAPRLSPLPPPLPPFPAMRSIYCCVATPRPLLVFHAAQSSADLLTRDETRQRPGGKERSVAEAAELDRAGCCVDPLNAECLPLCVLQGGPLRHQPDVSDSRLVQLIRSAPGAHDITAQPCRRNCKPT